MRKSKTSTKSVCESRKIAMPDEINPRWPFEIPLSKKIKTFFISHSFKSFYNYFYEK